MMPLSEVSISRKKRLSPLSIRPTDDDERAQLLRRAGNMPFSAWAKSVLLEAPARRVSRVPSLDRTLVAQILAALARSEMVANLDTLADAAQSGSLPLDDETEQQLQSALSDLATMRIALMQALGCGDWS